MMVRAGQMSTPIQKALLLVLLIFIFIIIVISWTMSSHCTYLYIIGVVWKLSLIRRKKGGASDQLPLMLLPFSLRGQEVSSNEQTENDTQQSMD